MALQGTDLFVVQSQDDGQLYKLRLDSLITEVEAQAGVNFRGSVDLNNAPGDQTPDAITLPGQNGDLYMVESDAANINAGWIMQNGETSATKGDRIIFDGDNANWILVSSGSSTAGTVTSITASLPLESDNDPVNPVISIVEARTTTAASGAGDGKGTDGAVHRLAEAADVVHTAGTADPRAVVTADLLKSTNDIVQGIVASAGGVVTVTYANSDGNNAILIPDTSGAVTLDVKNATETVYGVVNIADAGDITAGTAGGGAVVDASQLKEVADAIPEDIVASLTEGGTDIISGALQIVDDGDSNITIGVNKETFAPYDFSALTDITTI
jgi:hypothetical protein